MTGTGINTFIIYRKSYMTYEQLIINTIGNIIGTECE